MEVFIKKTGLNHTLKLMILCLEEDSYLSRRQWNFKIDEKDIKKEIEIEDVS